MILIAVRSGDGFEEKIGEYFTFESASALIEEKDADQDENPWFEGCDLVLIEGERQFMFDGEGWISLDDDDRI
jgi:hypothetical protein